MATSVPMSQQTTLHSDDPEIHVHPQDVNDVEACPPAIAVRGDHRRGPPAKGSPSSSGLTPAPVSWRVADKTAKYQGSGTHTDPYVVDWELGDPENPFNWSRRRKWAITAQVRRVSELCAAPRVPALVAGFFCQLRRSAPRSLRWAASVQRR